MSDHGQIGRQAIRQTDKWTNSKMDKRSNGHLNQWTNRQKDNKQRSDRQIVRQKDNEQIDKRTNGQTDIW